MGSIVRRSTSLRSRLLIFVSALIGAFALASATPAAALAMQPSGDTGDVKVHASTTPEDSATNDALVCEFYLDASGYDPMETVHWVIDQHPPTGTEQVRSGTVHVNPFGEGRTPGMALPVGHYQLTFKFEGERGIGSSKQFWSTCAGAPSPTQSDSGTTANDPAVGDPASMDQPAPDGSTEPSDSCGECSASPSESPSESPSASPSESACAECSASPTASPTGSESASESASPHGSETALPNASVKPGKPGKLAQTGGGAGGWLAVGGTVLAAGAALIRRARRPMGGRH